VAATISLLATAGCYSSEIRQQLRREDLRATERKIAQQEREARAQPAPSAPVHNEPDQPPAWRPLQLHLSGGPSFRWREKRGVGATLSLARIRSWPHETTGGGWLRGSFAGLGVEGTAGDDGVTLGPVLRLGTASGEYAYPGTNSADAYTYGQLVPFVGIRQGRLVSGLRLGGGVTVPGYLRNLLARNHDTLYADDRLGGLAFAGRLILVPLALVNHVDANIEATTEGKLRAGAEIGSDPSELAPLH
jgi:hypothetical protein